MYKSYKPILAPILALLSLSGCVDGNNEPDMAVRKDCPDFSATIDDSATRAFNQTWERGDRIGVSSSGRVNVCYVTNEGDGVFSVQTHGEQIYFVGDEEETFSAYYPWISLTGNSRTIKADTRNQNDSKSFDFLWATAKGKKTSPEVNFTFAHKMAKLTFTVKPGEGMSYTEAKTAKFSLNKLRHIGSFNISDGIASTDDTDEVWSVSDFITFDEAEGVANISLILFPQIFSTPLEFMAEMELTDNKRLSLKASIDFTSANREKDGTNAKNELVAGRQYNLSLTLHKTAISLEGCDINPWNVVNGENIEVD